MRLLLMFELFCVATLTVVAVDGNQMDSVHWRAYKSKFNKVYANTSEESMRMAIFFKNKRHIEAHNARNAPDLAYRMGLNHLSDWTRDELERLNGLRVGQADTSSELPVSEEPESVKQMLEVDLRELPEEIDWRRVPGRVTPVKFQGMCGSCWAFATTGVLEGQQLAHANLTCSHSDGAANLIPLSEENLVDCSSSNNGCYGGYMSRALDDVAKEQGIESEHDYPYRYKSRGPSSGQQREQQCLFDKSKSVMNVKGGHLLDKSELVLQKVVAQFGPVAVGIYSTIDFSRYESGVFFDPGCRSDKINHAILVVGYGTDPKQGDYWLVKNSWDVSWGEQGYGRLARNKNNHCGIVNIATIPII